MTTHKRRSQYAAPFWIRSLDHTASGTPLKRRPFSANDKTGDQEHDELWLQRLLYLHPQALPIAELEPGLREIIPVGLEMQTPAGFV